MKFHKTRTGTRSPLEGVTQYEQAIAAGRLRRVLMPLATVDAVDGLWKRFLVRELRYKSSADLEPLEIAEVVIPIRSAVVDELTRHPDTFQTFVPVVGDILVVAGGSVAGEADRPEPDTLVMVSAIPGQAVELSPGTWHTLPFSMAREAICLSIMHRHDLDGYHDVRDLAAEGWVAFPTWPADSK